MKLTAGTIKSLSLPTGKSELIVFDDDVPGFGLRLREGGSRSFVFQYKLGPKHRRIESAAIRIARSGPTLFRLPPSVFDSPHPAE